MKKNPEYLALLAGAAALTPTALKAQEAKHYNVILIESDDHAYQMISAYGGLMKTPGIDHIAEGGVRFDNSFVANSISGPSRACTITGKHSHKNGYLQNVNSHFDGNQQTFPKLLHAAGYQTAVVGKWHLGSLPQGFDYWEIFPGQGDYYNSEMITAPNDTVRQKGYASELVTDKSLAWLKDKRDPNRPFFLWIEHKSVHRDWLPRLDDLEKFEDVTFPVPDNFFDDYSGRPAAAHAEMRIGRDMDIAYDVKVEQEKPETVLAGYYTELINRLSPEGQKRYRAFYDKIIKEYNSKTRSEKEEALWKYQRYMRDYAKVVYAMDESIGRVMDYLEKEGLLENTIVMYTSDQGFYMGEHGFFDKRFIYEESFRTPLVMHLPKELRAKGSITEMVQNIDLAPTILDAAGVSIPADIQGRSLMPLLRGQKQLPGRDALYYHFYEYPAEHMAMRHYGIRTDRYKLVHFYNKDDFWELYDLKKDPKEMHNLIDDPAYQGVRKAMEKTLVSEQLRYDDKLALSLNHFEE